MFKPVAVCLLFASVSSGMTVYPIGNSLTNGQPWSVISSWATSRGHTFTYGKHVLFGSGLDEIWDSPGTTSDPSPAPFGRFPNALPNYEWDALVLEPYNDSLNLNLPYIKNFVDLALTNPANLDTQVYIFQIWPRSTWGDFRTHWDAGYPGNDLDGGWASTRDFYTSMVGALNATDLGLTKPVLTIPIGEVIYEVANRIAAGTMPGMSSTAELYVDPIHFNELGSFLQVSTEYATWFGESPAGLPPFGIEPTLALEIQKIAWQVVAGHSYSGVAATGDFDGDGKVTALDYGQWKLNYDRGIANAAGYVAWRNRYSGEGVMGDFDGDGKVTTLDYGQWKLNYDRGIANAAGYVAWRNNLNVGLGAASNIVPEPTAIAVLLQGIVCSLARCRSKPRSVSSEPQNFQFGSPS